MASLETRKNRHGTSYKIRFFIGKERKTLCLDSKYTRKQAEEVAAYAEKIAHAKATGGRFSRSLEGFIEEMPDDLRKRFESCGLLKERVRLSNRLIWKKFDEEMSLKRKPQTMVTYRTMRGMFFKHFDPDSSPNDIHEIDCDRWKAELVAQGYARATIASAIRRCKTVYQWAVDREYLYRNPFRRVEIEPGSFENPERMFYIPMESYEKLLEACPSQDWRTVLALCRIGGLRHNSETSLLTWGDVNWELGKLLVHSPKTERHRGRGTRLIPLFPQLREELERQFELAEPGGSPFILPDCKRTYWGYQLRRIIFYAGLETWPRVFQNLRESRANELWSEYPDHVAQAWMGHSKTTAQRFYLQVQDEHFQAAIKKRTVDFLPHKPAVIPAATSR